MNIKKAVAFFGSKSKMARAVGVKPPSVTRWSCGEPVSDLMQLRIEKLTGGRVKADPGIRDKWLEVLR